MFSVNLNQISFRQTKRRNRKCLSQSDVGQPSWVSYWQKKNNKLDRGRYVDFRSAVAGEKAKMYQSIRGQDGLLGF